ncbi:hypothetical protein [Methanocaldococcus sp.]|uniref:hypothetical protein n=1 Tax=Methanocaldococcus sp. TaxID=2152917 RepID=UPI002603438E|nr:hypothetical protein [Methanocaldococcus sp.]MCQ6254743.1 hypothetical protein [Methanocaldococcus sp.]
MTNFTYTLDELEKITLYPLRPIVGAENEITKMRRKQLLRLLEKIKNWDDNKKLKFLNILTNIVSVPYFSIDEYMKWIEEIEKKISELDDFKEIVMLKNLEKLIDYNQLKRIREEAMQNLKEDLEKLLEQILSKIENLENSKEVEELIVLGSMIQHIIDLIEQDYERNIAVISIFTLRIVAYLMNKISLDDLQLDLMKLSHMIPKVYVGDEHITKYFIKP